MDNKEVGVCIAQYIEDDMGDISEIIFIGYERPLLIVPRFKNINKKQAIANGNSGGFTNGQDFGSNESEGFMDKKTSLIAVGSNVELFYNPKTCIVTSIKKTSSALFDVKSENGISVITTTAVVNPNTSLNRRFQCWSREFGYIEVPRGFLRQTTPNVPLNVDLKLDVHFDGDLPFENELQHPKPVLIFKFLRFGFVNVEDDYVVKNAPWNKEIIYTDVVFHDDDDDYNYFFDDAVNEFNSFTLSTSLSGNVLVVEPNGAFSQKFPEALIHVPTVLLKDHRFDRGAILRATIAHQPAFDRYIVMMFSHVGSTLKLSYSSDGVPLFLADVYPMRNYRGFFYNNLLGAVHDSKNEIQEADKSVYSVWVRYVPKYQTRFGLKVGFLVESLAFEQTPEEIAKSLDDEYCPSFNSCFDPR